VVQVPEGSEKASRQEKRKGTRAIGSLVTAGVIILILLLPVGRAVRAVQHGTVDPADPPAWPRGPRRMADGDLWTRIPVSAG